MKTNSEILARAARATALIEDELFREAFKTLEAQYINAMVNTTAAESQARDNYWRAINILGDVQNHLKKSIVDGKIAQAEINKLGGVNRLAA